MKIVILKVHFEKFYEQLIVKCLYVILMSRFLLFCLFSLTSLLTIIFLMFQIFLFVNLLLSKITFVFPWWIFSKQLRVILFIIPKLECLHILLGCKIFVIFIFLWKWQETIKLLFYISIFFYLFIRCFATFHFDDSWTGILKTFLW